MESVTSSPILDLPAELQIHCFSALGEVDGTLVDALNMAMTNKKLYAIYEKHNLEINRHIITRSDVHAYDILRNHFDVQGRKMIREASPDSWAELSHNVQDFNESMLSGNITSDDIDVAQTYWKYSGRDRRYYQDWMSVYQSSPFPYRWDISTKSSIISPDELMALRVKVDDCVDWIPPHPSSFKSRFHKATSRRGILKWLRLVERDVGSIFSGIYWERFEKIANRDERWSFLEYLEGLELDDFWFGFDPWAANTSLNEGDRDAFRNKDWAYWYEELGVMSGREQAGIIEYPDLADRVLEPLDSFKRLISSESLPKDLEIALIQAWPSFRRNWPQTARCTVFSLYDSGEALAKIKEQMKTGSGTERMPLEDSSRSSLQE